MEILIEWIWRIIIMIEENIIKIIEEISGLNAKEIKSSELVDSGILDSFSLLVLISEIEKKLKITLNNENFDIGDFNNLSSILNYIDKNKQ